MAISAALAPGEQPRLVLEGLGSHAIVATDTRAFVFKLGASAGVPFRYRLKEFEYDSVMRIDLRRAGEIDVVVIHAPLKIASCSRYWADSRDDPWRARNAIPVGRRSAQAEQAVGELSRLLTASRRGKPVAGETRDVRGRVAEREPRSRQTGIVPIPMEPRIERGPDRRAEPAPGPATEDCPRCGNQLSAGWQFCPRCGAPSSGRPVRTTQRRRRRS